MTVAPRGIYEPAIDRGHFSYFDDAAVCAGSTGSCQVGRTHEKLSASSVAIRLRPGPSEILDLTAQLGREKDSKKAKALSQKIDQLQKQLGPEFLAVTSGLQHLDLNSPDGREIILIIGSLNQSCPE
jgi:hypothetical protein